MEYDVKRATRVDLQKRKAKSDAKLDKRSLIRGEWDVDEDDIPFQSRKKTPEDSSK